jgi:hypothetical protein
MTLDYYDSSNVIITSQPAELDPESGLYQSENVWKKYKRLSRKITVFNIGPGLLYVRTSHDGAYFSEETVILEGESKDFDEIYVIKLRSPTANLRYRCTEYTVSTVSGQQFSGSRIRDRRDRGGVIIFQDDMESPTLKFVPIIVGAGSVNRSIDVAYTGDFSLKMTTGVVNTDTTRILYFHPDFHEQKVGMQIQFSSASFKYDLHLVMSFFDGISTEYQAEIFTVGGIAGGNSLVAIDENGNNVVLISGVSPDLVQIFDSIYSWNVMKLVIDLSAQNNKCRYVSAEVNGKKVNFDIIIRKFFAPGIRRHIETQILLGEANAIAYLDNYIMTEDET